MSTYNRVIRKLVVGFGNLFDNITLYRFKIDETESERFIVPITYATKERYVMRLEADSELDKKVQITLPRMSFEMAGLTYDASRKQNTNIKNFKGTNSATGVIAQEIEKVLPGVVYDVHSDNGETYKAVRYGNIVGLLIEAIKELKVEVEDLKNGKLVDPPK